MQRFLFCLRLCLAVVVSLLNLVLIVGPGCALCILLQVFSGNVAIEIANFLAIRFYGQWVCQFREMILGRRITVEHNLSSVDRKQSIVVFGPHPSLLQSDVGIGEIMRTLRRIEKGRFRRLVLAGKQ